MDKKRRYFLFSASLKTAFFVPKFLTFSSPTSGSALSILILSAMLWVFEPVPAYVTGLLVVVLGVVLDVVPAAKISAAFFDPVMFVFITGFSLASVLEKHKIIKKISNGLVTQLLHLSQRGKDFQFFVLVSIMCVLVSSVLSNVPAAIVMSAIGKSLPTTDKVSAKRVALTIAFSCNIGGMVSPISSPQNLIALGSMTTPIGFVQWIQFAAPVCIAGIGIVYFVLRGTKSDMYSEIDSEMNTIEEDREVKDVPTEPWTWTQTSVLMIVFFTVFGWSIFDISPLSSLFGHIGIYGLLSVVILHGSGLLGPADWQALPWPVLTLLGGGLCLGTIVESSGLLEEMVGFFSGNEKYVFIGIIFSIGIISNFLSSTVCAIVTMPVVARLGASAGHESLFVLAAVMMTSGAMGLPVSSFPNANAAATEKLLSVKDFVRNGFAVTIGMVGVVLVVAAAHFQFS
jgi:phosphate transporter